MHSRTWTCPPGLILKNVPPPLEQWRIQLFKKEEEHLCQIFKLTDFGLSFTLQKVKFGLKREGGRGPLNPPLPSSNLIISLTYEDIKGVWYDVRLLARLYMSRGDMSLA